MEDIKEAHTNNDIGHINNTNTVEANYNTAGQKNAHKQWVTETVIMSVKQGYRVTPVYAGGKTQPYASGQTYPDPSAKCWENAQCVAVVLDGRVLVDWDGNKPEKSPITLVELEAKLGLDNLNLYLVQENEKGDSLHYLFKMWQGQKNLFKHSNDGWLPGVDIKTGNQLMHLKPHKTIIDDELPSESQLVNAPLAIIEALRIAHKEPTKAPPPISQADLSAELGELNALLGFIDPSLGYAEWCQVIAGTAHKFGDCPEAVALLDEWSCSGDNYNGDDIQAKYESFSRSNGNVTTFKSVCSMAKVGGADLGVIAKEKRRKQLGGNFDDVTFISETVFDCEEGKKPTWREPIQQITYSVPDQVKSNPLIRFALDVSRAFEFPEGSTVFTALGAFSAACNMAYCLQYEDGERLPIGLFVTIEQPPSSSKSRVLNRFMKPINQGIVEINGRINKENGEAAKNDPKAPFVIGPLSNTTAEGLEKQLHSAACGRFIIASAEQGAVNQILAIDANRTTDKDLILKAYVGEFHSSARVTRTGYSGDVYGSIVLLAQPGMSRKILRGSGGEGLAERFLFVSEPHLLGKRTHDTSPLNMSCEGWYILTIAGILKHFELSKRPSSMEQLTPLKLSKESWLFLKGHKLTIEPMLKDFVNRGVMTLASALGKCDIHAMKVAGCLHVAEHCNAEGEVPDQIEIHNVKAAVDLIMLQFSQLEKVLEREGETGESAARETVLRKFAKRDSWKPGVLLSDLKNVKPFKDMPEPYKAAKEVVRRMLLDCELQKDSNGGLSAS